MSDENYQDDDLNYESEEEDEITNALKDINEAYDEIELYGKDKYTQDQQNEFIRSKEQKLLELLKDEGLISMNNEDFEDPLTNDYLDIEIANPNISTLRKENLEKLKLNKEKHLGNFIKK